MTRRRCCCDEGTPFNDDGVSVTVCFLQVECGTLVQTFEHTGNSYATFQEASQGCFTPSVDADCDPDQIPNSGDEYQVLQWDPPLGCIPQACECDCGCGVEKQGTCPKEGEYFTTSSGGFSQCWTFPFVSRFDQALNGTFWFLDGSNLFGTGYTAFATANVERYEGTYNVNADLVQDTSAGYLCCDYAPTATVSSMRVEYVRSAAYTQDIPVLRVQGASTIYAAWTVEITSSDCVIRDGGGTTQYTFDLSSYTIDGLRVALNNLGEIICIRDGALVPTSQLRNVSAQYIPVQSAQPIGSASASTWALVDIRFAGDLVEPYQRSLPTPKYSCFTGAGFGTLQGVMYLHKFSGTANDFRFGWQLRYDPPASQNCDASDPCCRDCSSNFVNNATPVWMDPSVPSGPCVPTEVGAFFYPQPGVTDPFSDGWAEGNVFCPTGSPIWTGGTGPDPFATGKNSDPVTFAVQEVCDWGKSSLGSIVGCNSQYHCMITKATGTRLTRRMFTVQRNF